jgi:hypothetical protein
MKSYGHKQDVKKYSVLYCCRINIHEDAVMSRDELATPMTFEQKEGIAQDAPISHEEDTNFGLTPESLNHQVVPREILLAAASYAQGALGSGTEVKAFQQTSKEPEMWKALICNTDQKAILVAKRVSRGYDLYVEDFIGSTEGQI